MNIYTNRYSIIIHSGFWILFTGLFALLLSNFIPPWLALARVSTNVFFMAFVFYFNALILVNLVLENKMTWYFLLAAFVLLLISSIVRFYVLQYFSSLSQNVVFPAKPVRLAFVILITNAIVIIISTFYQLLRNRTRRERRKQEIINRQNEAQIQFLKAQINPHFLFNTLNNIYALAVTRSENTPEMILKLSDLLRYVIYKGRQERVFLITELEHLRKFIDLFRMKSEDPMNISFQVEGNPGNLAIEPMVLIPIVENCFKHADFDTNPEAYIKIMAMIHGNMLKFITLNTKDEADTQKDRTGGVGIENIRKRLELNYKGMYELSIQNKKQIFEVNLSIILDNGENTNTVG